MAYNRFSGYRAQTRSAVIKYVCAVSVPILLAAVLQVSVLARFRVWDSAPDLMLCLLLCFSFFEGRQTGAVVGIVSGFLIEAVGASGIMLLPLFYMLFGYMIGHYARGVVGKRFSSYTVYLLLTLLFRAAVTITYICLTYRQIQLTQLFLYILLPEALLTFAAGLILYLPMRLYSGLLGGIK